MYSVCTRVVNICVTSAQIWCLFADDWALDLPHNQPHNTIRSAKWPWLWRNHSDWPGKGKGFVTWEARGPTLPFQECCRCMSPQWRRVKSQDFHHCWTAMSGRQSISTSAMLGQFHTLSPTIALKPPRWLVWCATQLGCPAKRQLCGYCLGGRPSPLVGVRVHSQAVHLGSV